MSDHNTEIDRLREAAQVMRDRADLPYVKGEWEACQDRVRRKSNSPRIGHPSHARGEIVLYDDDDAQVASEAVAEHIAAWDPVVAEAVADLLELIATRHQPHDRSRVAPEVVCDGEGVNWPCDHVTKALAVARHFWPGKETDQ